MNNTFMLDVLFFYCLGKFFLFIYFCVPFLFFDLFFLNLMPYYRITHFLCLISSYTQCSLFLPSSIHYYFYFI